MKHTTAPWKIIEREILEDGSVFPRHVIGGITELQVCLLESPAVAHAYTYNEAWKTGGNSEMQKANTRLIASAPELYAALVSVVSRWDGTPHDQTPIEVKDARAALAKVAS